MKKSKILAVALAAALAASMAVTANAESIGSIDAIKDHTVGAVGSFNAWGAEGDVALTDADGDGVYEGAIEIAEVTEDMILPQTTDEGDGAVETGKSGVCFKVRLDGAWDDSWGEYEWAYVRTWNSQTNLCAPVKAGDKNVVINVKFDTTKNSAAAIANGDITADEPLDFHLLEVTFTTTVDGEEVSDVSEEPSETSKEESVTSTASTPETSKEESVTSTASEVSTSEYYESVITDYVFFDNSNTKWENVYAYWWNDDFSTVVNKLTGALYPSEPLSEPDENGVQGQAFDKWYPGQKMSQIPGTDVWQTAVPVGATKIIFNMGISDDQVKTGVTAYQTGDLNFSDTANAGQVYTIDTSVEAVPGRGIEKTKYKYNAGSWSAYSGDYIKETFGTKEREEASKAAAEVSNKAGGSTGTTSTVSTASTASKSTTTTTTTKTTSNATSTAKGDSTTVTTGDSSMAVVFAAVAVAALGAAVIATKKKRVEE